MSRVALSGSAPERTVSGLVAATSVEVDAARYRLIARLVESLAHDVRNPLNALSINLEVLTEKLKGVNGAPPAQEKHLLAIRNQVSRVNAILRTYTDFITPGVMTETIVNFSQCLTRATEILGHESRRRRVTLECQTEAGLRVRLGDPDLAPFLALEPLMRGLGRSPEGGVVRVAWSGKDGIAHLHVQDDGAAEVGMNGVTGLQSACAAQNLVLTVDSANLDIRFPLV